MSEPNPLYNFDIIRDMDLFQITQVSDPIIHDDRIELEIHGIVRRPVDHIDIKFQVLSTNESPS